MPEPYMRIPIQGPKVTAAVWGPCDEYIVTGHENGALSKWDPQVISTIFRAVEIPAGAWGNRSIFPKDKAKNK